MSFWQTWHGFCESLIKLVPVLPFGFRWKNCQVDLVRHDDSEEEAASSSRGDRVLSETWAFGLGVGMGLVTVVIVCPICFFIVMNCPSSQCTWVVNAWRPTVYCKGKDACWEGWRQNKFVDFDGTCISTVPPSSSASELWCTANCVEFWCCHLDVWLMFFQRYEYRLLPRRISSRFQDLKRELLQYLANRDCLMLFPGFLSCLEKTWALWTFWVEKCVFV